MRGERVNKMCMSVNKKGHGYSSSLVYLCISGRPFAGQKIRIGGKIRFENWVIKDIIGHCHNRYIDVGVLWHVHMVNVSSGELQCFTVEQSPTPHYLAWKDCAIGLGTPAWWPRSSGLI